MKTRLMAPLFVKDRGRRTCLCPLAQPTLEPKELKRLDRLLAAGHDGQACNASFDPASFICPVDSAITTQQCKPEFTKDQRAAAAKSPGRKGFKAHEFKRLESAAAEAKRQRRLEFAISEQERECANEDANQELMEMTFDVIKKPSIASSRHRTSKRCEHASFARSAGFCQAEGHQTSSSAWSKGKAPAPHRTLALSLPVPLLHLFGGIFAPHNSQGKSQLLPPVPSCCPFQEETFTLGVM